MGRSAPIREFQDSTRGRLLMLLLDGPATVSELSEELGLTDNAVRAQIVHLRTDGYVRREGERRSGGRPAHVYGLAPRAQEAFPDGSRAALRQLIETLQERLDPEDVAPILSETGRRIARRLHGDGSGPAFPGADGTSAGGNAPADAAPSPEAGGETAPLEPDQVLALLEELGGDPEMEIRNGTVEITSPTCLLGPATRNNESACEVTRALVEELLGAPAEACCRHEDGWPRCGFEVDLPGDGA